MQVVRALYDTRYRSGLARFQLRIWHGADSQGHVGNYLMTNVITEASKALTAAMKKVNVKQVQLKSS